MDPAIDLPARVLLVHSSADVRKLVVKHLAGRYAVETARTPRTALKAMASCMPEAILVQARLLAAKDFQLLQRIRGECREPSPPVILVYGPGDADSRVAALAAGVDDLLSESFDALELQSRIDVNVRAARIRRDAEIEFGKHEERLRDALRAVGAGAYRWDFRSGYVEWDESFDSLIGIRLGQPIKTHDKFLSLLHPDDRDRVDRACGLCLSTGADFDTEYRLKSHDGSYVWIHDRARTVRDVAGRPVALLGACFDATERKQSEFRRQFITDLDEALRPLADPLQITATSARLLGEHLSASRCCYADVLEDGDAFDVLGEYARDVVSVIGRYKWSQFGSVTARLMAENIPSVICDTENHQPPLEDAEGYRRTQTRASICVPLHKNGRLVSAMAVHQCSPRDWTADEIELVKFVVNRCWESMERARVTRQLQESEHRFRQLAEFVPLIVWEASADGAVEYYNNRWYDFTGVEPGVTGDESWAPSVHPDDRQNVQDAWSRAVRQGEPYQIECRVKDRRTGDYRWMMGRAIPVKDADGNVVRWFGANADVHEAKLTEQALRRNEERLQAIIEATPECVKVVSRDGHVLQMNSGGLTLLGAKSEDDVRGKAVLDFIAPDYRQTWMDNHERVCAGESRRWEFAVVFPGGERRWMECHGVPVSMHGGELAHLSVTRDVTERRRFELEREELLFAERTARAEAETTGRLKDEFLATLSHELRTPLNAILGYATLIRLSPMDVQERDDALETIERNARLQAQLIDDLLEMNRIISGNVRLDVHTINLPEVIETVVESAAPIADAKGVRLDTVIDPLAKPVRGDRARLQQIFGNLIANGVKFTPPGGRVQIALESVASQIDVTVSDTGEGITADFLPHVFDRFRQADAGATRKYGGLGVGLSIVKHLVELHGGAVRAHSAGRGQGASFVVSFPVAAVLDERDLARRVQVQTAPSAPPPGPVDLSGVKVLAVDDEPDACMLVKRVLETTRASVETASSARAALDLLDKRRFDVLISDIGMPIEDGYDLMRAVRSMQGSASALPAIALTAFARPEDSQRAALAGFHTHVAKPVEANKLIAIVANLAGRASD
jgi:PAS domain S-box-containing protein